MALHDVDKSGQNRLSPTINSKDNLPPDTRMAHGTTQVTNKDEQDTDGSVQVQESAIRSVDSDGNVVALLGYQPGGFGSSDFGFKVAKPGYSADTATDDQLIMSSKFNSFKIVNIGVDTATLSKPANDSGETVSIPHGLTFTPAVIAYIDDSGLYYPLPHITVVDDGTSTLKIGRKVAVTVDATNINFTVTNASTGTFYTNSVSYTFKFFVLVETAD